MKQNINIVISSEIGTSPLPSQQLPQPSVTGLSIIILALTFMSLGYMITLAIQSKYQGKIEIMVGDDIHVNIEGTPLEK